MVKQRKKLKKKTSRGISRDRRTKSKERHEKKYGKHKTKPMKVGNTYIRMRKINGVNRKARVMKLSHKKYQVRVFKKKKRTKKRR